MNMNSAELSLILTALNDRESVLCANWESADRANSTALMMTLCDELREVRKLADKIANQLIVANRLAA